jgi:ABC-type transport system substrate-binding protein
MLEKKIMNRKKILLIMTGFGFAIGIALLSFSFHQKAPENTIRILVEKPMDPNHPRITPLVSDSGYRYQSHGEDFDLIPPETGKPVLRFQVVRDENTRAVIFLKEDADILYDNLSVAKTEWVRKKMTGRRIRILSSRGDAISYLALNQESFALRDADTRARVASALPLKNWIEKVFLNWVEPANQANAAPLTGATPLDASATRIVLRYLATPTREGQQLAHLTREALKKSGFDVRIHIYEPALFYAKIRNRDFDLFSSTAVEGMKTILDLPHTDLIPLFRWKHGLIVNPRVRVGDGVERDFDYSFRFLKHLQLQ